VPALARTYRPGEKVHLEVKLRNVGKANVTITHGLLHESPPTITDAKGASVFVTMPPILGIIVIPTERVLKPGQTVTLYNPEVAVEAFNREPQTGPEPLVSTPTIRVRPGKYKIAFGGMVHSHLTLSTGTAEVEVQEPVKPVAATEEAFTAWGKEVEGVQAGLGYLPAARRTYTPGETVRLVVRVRNNGKKDVKFVYAWESFYEEPPVVTDDAGKTVTLKGVFFSGLIQFKEVTLAPGKEIDLCELNLAVQPASEKDKARPWSLYGTGKFQLQFERIGGNIGTGKIKFDPVLSKLVTGKLELEIKSAPPPATEKK
jgi:hypothetical protein